MEHQDEKEPRVSLKEKRQHMNTSMRPLSIDWRFQSSKLFKRMEGKNEEDKRVGACDAFNSSSQREYQSTNKHSLMRNWSCNLAMLRWRQSSSQSRALNRRRMCSTIPRSHTKRALLLLLKKKERIKKYKLPEHQENCKGTKTID